MQYVTVCHIVTVSRHEASTATPRPTPHKILIPLLLRDPTGTTLCGQLQSHSHFCRIPRRMCEIFLVKRSITKSGVPVTDENNSSCKSHSKVQVV